MPRIQRYYTIMGWIAVAYMAVLFLYPLLRVLVESLTDDGAFSFQNYADFFAGKVYLEVLGRTLWISVVSTVIALVLGYSLAYFIATRSARSQGLWLMFVLAPMFMSLTVRLFGWMILLGGEGPINSFLTGLNPDWELPLLFNTTAVILGIVHYILPFAALNIYTSLKKMDAAVLEASTMLGASSARTFWRVTFPLSLPGVFAGASVAFALSANTFLVPIMLGGPSNQMLSNMAYDSIVKIGNFGLGSAISILLLIVVVLALSMIGRLEKGGRHAE